MKCAYKIISIIIISAINHYCYGQQDTSVTTPPKLDFHYESSFKITDEDGVKVYRRKRDNKKPTGYIKFDCLGDGEGSSSEGLFQNGKKHKRWLVKICNDATRYEINYDMGIMNGRYKVYISLTQKKDTVFYETTFTNGTGIWKDFHSNGDIKEVGEYKSNKKEGEWLIYDKGNILCEKWYYENGISVKMERIELPPGYFRESKY